MSNGELANSTTFHLK